MKHIYKIGQVVTHIEKPNLIGVIVRQIRHGQIENTHTDDMVVLEDSHCDTMEEYNEPWYRILWLGSEKRTQLLQLRVELDCWITETIMYNGQESEGTLVPILN